MPNDQRRCFQFLGKIDSVGRDAFKFNKAAAGLNLTLKSCFEESLRTRNQKARAFEPQMMDNLEIFSHNKSQKMANSEIDTRGNPLDFLDEPLFEKIVVAVDVDEVLGTFLSALNCFIGDRYSLKYLLSDYHVYDYCEIWNCSPDEADDRVHEFFKASHFKQGIHPIPGALRALQNISKFCKLSVVTSRQNVIKDQTIEWLEKHYPGVFQEIHFGNHFAREGVSTPKSEICRFLGAKILIDCAKKGIRVLLFDYENSYPWCKTDLIDQHPLVTKVHNWEDAERQITYVK